MNRLQSLRIPNFRQAPATGSQDLGRYVNVLLKDLGTFARVDAFVAFHTRTHTV